MDKMDKQSDSHLVQAFKKFARSTIERAAIDYERSKQRNSDAIPFSNLWEGYVEDKLQLSDAYLYETRFEYPVFGEIIYITDAELADALNSLSEHQRNIILMYYFLGMTDKAISEAIQVKRRTVNATRLMAVEKLKGYLEVVEYEDH